MYRREALKKIALLTAGAPFALKSIATDKQYNLYSILSSPNFGGAITLDNKSSDAAKATDVNEVRKKLGSGPVVVCFGWTLCDTLCPQIHAALSEISRIAGKNLTILVVDILPSNDNQPKLGIKPEFLFNKMYEDGVPRSAHIVSIFPASDAQARNVQIDDFKVIANPTNSLAHSSEILLFDGKTGNFVAQKSADQSPYAFDEWRDKLNSRSR